MPGIKQAVAEELNKPIDAKPYSPDETRIAIETFASGRIDKMQEFRSHMRIEQEWRNADREYLPTAYEFGAQRRRFETDQDTGLRSRLVPITSEEDNWRSNSSDPTLLVKIQTALSIIIDQTPMAILAPLVKKYQGTAVIAQAGWKRNWEITDAKFVYRKFLFNLFKYGWGVGRTYPKELKYSKQVLESLDPDDPEKNKYRQTERLLFRDVMRENLDPYRTWIDEATRPYDRFSMNDDYFEIDYSYDQAAAEYGFYKHWDSVLPQSAPPVNQRGISNNPTGVPGLSDAERMEQGRQDIVTIGFYENRLKDLFVIRVPQQKIVLFNSPLPNDDGELSLWHTHLYMRDAKNPYGISLWRIIQQDKELYDKMKNMTMDQLVLSIMKMFFYTGSSNLFNDGKIRIAPGKGQQIVNGKIDWMDVPGPGDDSWKGLDFLQAKLDSNSGITPTLEGEVEGKTLGEVLHAKESALKRIRTPLENVANAIEQDAYITVSWMGQLYTTPMVKEFASEEEMNQYEKSEQTEHNQLFANTNQETGAIEGPIKASYLPEIPLHLENRNGQYFESTKSRFFQVGKDIPIESMKWRGIIKVIPSSVLSPSVETARQGKMELGNILAPLIVQPPEIMGNLARTMVEANQEDPEDWLPEPYLQFLGIHKAPPPPLMVPQGMPPGGTPSGAAPGGMPGGRMTGGFESMQGGAGITPNPGAPTVLPQSQVAGPSTPTLGGSIGNSLGR